MEWNSIETPPISYGWYAVALNPPCLGLFTGKDYLWLNSWRKNPLHHSFEKAWFNGSKWFVVDQFTPKRMDVTDRITHWTKLPEVPLFG